MRGKHLLGPILGQAARPRDASIAVTDRRVIESFSADPDNTFLVSFPRTGSHWLRMIMELYFERPSLVRVFYYPERSDYLTLHTHDLELDVERTNVIYLYRDPVDTIFSQLCYHGESLDDHERITYWADLYGRHLDKWLYRERFTTLKTILTYEGLKHDLATEFAKVARHFAKPLDRGRLGQVAARVTKQEVSRRAKHDPQVIHLSTDYEPTRRVFREERGPLVWDVVKAHRPHLAGFFSSDNPPRK